MKFKNINWITFFWIVLICLYSCTRSNYDLAMEATKSVTSGVILPDSILHQLEIFKGDKDKLEYLLSSCRKWHTSQPGLAMKLATLAVELSYSPKTKTSQYAQALYWKSFIMNQEDPESIELQSTLSDIRISITIFEDLKDNLWLARALNLRALIHYNLYDEGEGQIHNDRAQRVLQQAQLTVSSYPKVWGDIFRIAGNIELYTSKNTDKVLAYFDKSRACYTVLGDDHQLARLLTNYAIVYERRKETELADSIFQEAINLYQQLENKDHLAKIYLDYATFLSTRFKVLKEKKWLEESNQWLTAAKSLQPRNTAEILFQFGANFHNKALYSLEPSKKLYYDSAGLFYRAVLDIGIAEKNTKYIEKVSLALAKICPRINPSICRDLLKETSNAYQAIADSTTQAMEQAARIIEQFQKEEAKEYQNRIIYGSIFSIVVLIILFVALLQSSKIKLLLAKMEAFRSQMNPHFISNSLNAIDSLVNQNRNEEASEYIIDFSRLCRLVLNNSKKKMISLEKELETLGYYLSLEQLRMRRKLHYQIEVDQELDQKKIMIPPMMFQPFVENAIIHGIQNKQAPGRISLSIYPISRSRLECIIEDDGVGRARANTIKTNSVIDRPSWGIQIAQESMKQMRGTKITIVDLKNEQQKACGTQIILNIPITTRVKK